MNKIPKTIIISSKPGQLGNMLFLFSHLIAFAIEKNISIKAPAFEEHAAYFDSTSKVLVPSYPQSKSAIRSKRLCKLIYDVTFILTRIIYKLKLNNRLFSCIYIDWNESLNLEDEAKQKLLSSRYVFIQGWLFQANSLIRKHRAEIIYFFKPLDIHINNVNKLISTDHEILIGVHIRHGDYKIFEGGRFFFTIDQYVDAMKKTLALFPQKKILFLICSDFALNHDDFKSMLHIFGTGNVIEDLYAFSKCNYLVGPPSSFTIWASFSGKVPFYQIHDPKAEFGLKDFKIALS